MEFYWTDILVAALLVVSLVGVRPQKPFAPTNEAYLSLDTGRSLRGAFILAIVFHHLSTYSPTGVLFTRFTGIGYLCVSIFFFLSGYGLMKSHMRGPQYRKTFLQKRLPTVLFPFLVALVLYWAVFRLLGTPLSVGELFGGILATDIVVETLPVSFLWYVLVIVEFYLVFWLLMTIFKDRYKPIIAGGLVWFVLHTLLCMKLGLLNYFYKSAVLLVVGTFWAVYESSVLKAFNKHPALITVALWVTFLVLFGWRGPIETGLTGLGIPGASTLLNTLIAPIFLLAVVLSVRWFRFGNKALDYLGKISFEIYLTHGLFIALLYNTPVFAQSQFLFCVLVLAGTLVLASLLHPAFAAVLGAYKKAIAPKE